MPIAISINGTEHLVEASEDTALIFVLRNELGLYGAKLGCGLEQCGACVVLADGEPVHACTLHVSEVRNRNIETVEGLATANGDLHPIQAAILDHNAAQCGYCLGGILMRAKALLAAHPNPSRNDICQALDGHLCRCGAQPRIIRAIESAALRLRSSS